ncbi:MAG: 3-hydroxyacyl-CoA dehydrogenase NAD-binding domain-containing protein [Steroidobacteraceae bacterium]
MTIETTAASNAQNWQLVVDADRIAWLTFDKPDSSANTLSRQSMRDLESRLGEIEQLKPRAVIVQSGKKSGFIAGADIKEFTSLTSTQQAFEMTRAGQKVLDRLEALPCPSVAAINGFALGGGLELALACHYRVAADDPKVSLALPEVQLGIHPGFGGTVRLVQLIGPVAAMDMMLTGKSLRADKAARLGLLDRLSPADQLAATARALALAPPSRHRAGFKSWLMGLAPVRPFIAAQMEKQVAKRAPREHYPAPYALIDLWRRYGGSPRTGYEPEARSIAEMFQTPTSRNLVRVFLLQDRLKALGTRPERKAEHVHVVGAGVMGGDIASWCAVRGMNVTLQDRELKFISPALERARAFFEKRYADQSELRAVTERLQPDVEGNGATKADVIIEAIFENAEAKRELYAKLEPKMQPSAILGTNTSSIMLETLATGLADSGRLVGLHFFNPVARMPLVEVIHSQSTRPDVLQAAINFARQIDKLPLPCKSAPGFVVNRILIPYMIEATLLAQEGVPLALIDKAATDFGMPMGPIELTDVVGLDVALHVGKILADAFGKPTSTIVQSLVEQKKLGKKSGQGFYVWQDGKPVKPHAGDVRPPADLQDRLILPMINESVAVLREAIVADADLLDAGVVFGTGFAPFRGGPLHYARARGAQDIVRCLKALAKAHGKHHEPDAGWETLS